MQMGMGSAPCHAWTISLDGLKAICPKEVKAFETVLKQHDSNWDSFALAIDQEELDDHSELANAWINLQRAFAKATKVGKSHLELGIGHYSSDNGDQYDDLEQGCYLTVDNVTQLTAAGKKFSAQLEQKSWTVFG
jgi:hypothetical protein